MALIKCIECGKEISDKAKQWIVDNGYDHNYGARPLKRFLSKNLETLLAKKLIDGSVISGDNLMVDASDDKLVISKNSKV